MELNVYTLFDRVDGAGAQLQLARSDNRIVKEIVGAVEQRNAELKQRNYPIIDLRDYELRRIGTFEDSTCSITPLPNYVVVPLTNFES